jgi:hypothetical protein
VSSDDFKTSLLALAWAFRLLPLLVVGIVGFSFRNRLRQPFAFAVLGTVIFFGVAWIVSQFTWNWRLGVMASSLEDQLAVAVLSSALVQFAVSAALSVVPVVWLFRLLSKEKSIVRPDT